MKTYLSDIIPRIKRFSKELDNLTLLLNQHWVDINNINHTKNVFIFRRNNELLFSQNGIVEKARWEYLGNDSLLIERKDEPSILFKHGFFDDEILALKIDGGDKFTVLANETKCNVELNSIEVVGEFLSSKYLLPPKAKVIEEAKYTLSDYSTHYISETYTYLDGYAEKFRIDFEDGMKGEIHFLSRSLQAYFKVIKKEDNFLIESKYYYKNKDSCIKGLHYFLKAKGILEKGLLRVE